jgi:hypothetical protein
LLNGVACDWVFVAVRCSQADKVLGSLKLEYYKVQFRVPFMSVSVGHIRMSTAGSLYLSFFQKEAHGVQLFESSDVVRMNCHFSPSRCFIN